jgi:hypothetical protein
MKTNIHLLYYFPQFFLECETFQTEFVEKTKLRILCSLIFFLNRAFYEIMWRNIVEPGRTRWLYGACALHTGHLRLRAHAQNT